MHSSSTKSGYDGAQGRKMVNEREDVIIGNTDERSSCRHLGCDPQPAGSLAAAACSGHNGANSFTQLVLRRHVSAGPPVEYIGSDLEAGGSIKWTSRSQHHANEATAALYNLTPRMSRSR